MLVYFASSRWAFTYLNLGCTRREEYNRDIRAVDFDGAREFYDSRMLAFTIGEGLY